MLTLSSLAITMAPMPSDHIRNALSSLQDRASAAEAPFLRISSFLSMATFLCLLAARRAAQGAVHSYEQACCNAPRYFALQAP